MRNQYDSVVQLTSARNLAEVERRRILTDFALELGWEPSDLLETPVGSELAVAHLIVEHGLENTAVITFLKDVWRFADLNHSQRMSLLAISYNNLVDWHIQVERDRVTFVFNRTDTPRTIVDSQFITRENFDSLRREAFESVIGRRPNPNIPPLDDALIETIRNWRRNLSAEMGYSVSNEALSALFNAIFFVRALEDHYRQDTSSRTLLESWSQSPSLLDILLHSLQQYTNGIVPDDLIERAQLDEFKVLDRQTVYSLLADFYRSKYAPYEYNFALMSKHALSRIYEHYVSILRLEETPQLSLPLLPRLPSEERDKAYGSIYTPQFIARFFAKYLREQIPRSTFKRLRTSDPACGCGIFLRTLLELQCDPVGDGITDELIHDAFANILGIDIDKNATEATRLSLSLLHLVLTDKFPKRLEITSADAIQYFEDHPELIGSFDAVVANPPYVALGTQPLAVRERVASFMRDYATGRVDLYLAFLRIGLEMLRPGGYGLFVLPHSFLLSKSASRMRQWISEDCWIRCIADLSAIRVFGESGIYVVLLIFQKKPEQQVESPPAMIVKCRDLVGLALQDAVQGRRVESDSYNIYDVEQQMFAQDEWLIVPPNELRVKRRLDKLPVIQDFMHVRVGFIAGDQDVFIRRGEQIPKGEEDIFVPYLPDRDMELYTVPEETNLYFFYPYVNGELISENLLRHQYPKTWNYLLSYREQLAKRGQVQRGQVEWWRPERPRTPENMMRPKIISPHLVVLSLSKGKFG